MAFYNFIQRRGDSFPFFITLVDVNAEDHPLTYVNKSFKDFTGYGDEDFLGRNCRFLQGKSADEDSRLKIRNAIAEKKPLCIDSLNYKKNGEKFYNRLILLPIKERNSYYLGLQNVIPESQFGKFPELTDSEIMDKTINPLSILLISDINAPEVFEQQFSLLVARLKTFIHM